MRVTLKTPSRVSCYIKPPYTKWWLRRFKGLSEVNARVNVFISVKEWLHEEGALDDTSDDVDRRSVISEARYFAIQVRC